MKPDLTSIVILALVVIVILIPAVLYLSDFLHGDDNAPVIADYCNANGFMDVYPCIDGSFQAIRENFSEGFRIVKPDGSGFECPFTLPQYQVGDCIEYTTEGMCGYMGDICGNEGACVSDLDCAGECVNWTCSYP